MTATRLTLSLLFAGLALAGPWPQARGQCPPQPGKSPPAAFLPSAQAPPPAAYYAAPAPGQPLTIKWGPGPIGLSLGWFGRQLQRFEKTHTWVINHGAASAMPASCYSCGTHAPGAFACAAECRPTPQTSMFPAAYGAACREPGRTAGVTRLGSAGADAGMPGELVRGRGAADEGVAPPPAQ